MWVYSKMDDAQANPEYIDGLQDFNDDISSFGDEDQNNTDSEGGVDSTQRRKVLESRRKWALFHFYALRPAFSVSLILYLASITSGQGAIRFRSSVVHPIQNLATLVRMESKAYTECVHQYTNRTARNLEQLAQEDGENASKILQSNKRILQQAEDVANGCHRDMEKSREELVQWRQDGMDIPWKEVLNSSSPIMDQHSSCSVEKRNLTEEFLGENHRAIENQMNNTLQTFISGSQYSLKAVSDYALERFDYDWDYFIMGHIQPAIDFLTEHSVSIQAAGIDIRYNITEIEISLNQQVQAMQQVLEKAKDHIDVLQSKLDEFRGSINGLYVNYSELYNRMIEAAETVSEFLPPGVPLPDVFDISGLHLADSFLPPTGLVWPELEINYADIQQVSQNIAQSCLHLMTEILDDAEVQSLQGLRGTIQGFVQRLIEILELKNYQPPQFQGTSPGISDLKKELEYHSLNGQEALNRTTQTMINLRERSPGFHNLTIDVVETPRIELFAYNSTEETSTTFELLDILMPDLSLLEYIMSRIAAIGEYTFLLDMLCGLFQWWKLSGIYEDGAMPNMPQIDYGVSDRDKRERPQANSKILLLIAKSLLNPMFIGFLCIASLFGSLAITFWIPHVQQMCVHSVNGTWFANHMVGPMLVNTAVVEGNTQYLFAEHFCHSSRNQLCANIHFEMERKIFVDNSTLQRIKDQHSHSLENFELINCCMDTSHMTTMLDEACCGLKGHRIDDCNSDTNYICPLDFSTSPPSAYRPINTYLESSSCSESLNDLMLNGAKHECTGLNTACNHVPCNGVNDELIQKLANQTDCKVELWIIHSFRFWATAIVHFMALYAICSLLYLGCRDFHWRKISPDCIGLRTHLLENGVLAKGGKLQERSKMISDEIQWFERKARLQLLVGVFLLLSYTVAVSVLCAKG